MTETVQAFLCTPGFEAALAAEVDGSILGPGAVTSPDRPLDLDPTFARQLLPEALVLDAPSVAKLADAALESVATALDACEAFRLDVFVADVPEDPRRPLGEHAARARLLEERFLESLKTRRRRTAKRRSDSPEVARLQLFLVERERVVVSLAAPIRLPAGAFWPSRFPGGRAPVLEDRDAPSRAYKKLKEALDWVERPIRRGETCVDLGAAPGGWTWALLEAGAVPIAIDRAELDPRLMADRRVKFFKSDAFQWQPEAPVDWLLSDVIAAPEKSLGLLERWLEHDWCDAFVLHLKFKGSEQYGLIAEARDRLAARRPGVRAKHLLFDKNEITLLSPGRQLAAG